MIQAFKDIVRHWRLKSRVHHALQPEKEFLDSARESFLKSVRTMNGNSTARMMAHARYWRYAFIALFVVVISTGGLAALADNADVSTDNVLYPLKRVSEQVRLDLTLSDEQKIKLHEDLAQRRLRELEALRAAATTSVPTLSRTAAPTMTVLTVTASASRPPLPASAQKRVQMIQRLNEDFRDEVDRAIERAEHVQTPDGSDRKIEVCTRFNQAVQDHLVSTRDSNTRDWLKTRCLIQVKISQ
ncbi:MAG TPA: DUF5667 domain-containing protein [Candidatus Paceibacterota bacterium]|nr:DUF5667 domain-containing protein [Candidatus Paceibacterota bacterium]